MFEPFRLHLVLRPACSHVPLRPPLVFFVLCNNMPRLPWSRRTTRSARNISLRSRGLTIKGWLRVAGFEVRCFGYLMLSYSNTIIYAFVQAAPMLLKAVFHVTCRQLLQPGINEIPDNILELWSRAVTTGCKVAKTELFKKWLLSGKDWCRNLVQKPRSPSMYMDLFKV